MRERIEIYACGSNLHQQICGHHEENGEPLTLDTPTFVDLNDETAVQVLAISASQIIYSINEVGKERIRVKGFANVPGFETIHRCNLDPRAVKTWLGRDTIQAYLTTEGQIVDVQSGATLRDGISHAAMDSHGRLLAISQGMLLLYKSLEEVHSSQGSTIPVPDEADLSKATIHAGASHFIISAFARQGKGEASATVVYALGDNRFFQQGHPFPSSWTALRKIEFFDESMSQIKKIACGDLHTAFLTIDGALYMSGSDAKGQCGGHSEQDPCLVDFEDVISDGDVDVMDIACGNNHTIALTNKGIFVTGGNNAGQLGISSLHDSPKFVNMPLASRMSEHALAVYAAGWNTVITVPSKS